MNQNDPSHLHMALETVAELREENLRLQETTGQLSKRVMKFKVTDYTQTGHMTGKTSNSLPSIQILAGIACPCVCSIEVNQLVRPFALRLEKMMTTSSGHSLGLFTESTRGQKPPHTHSAVQIQRLCTNWR